MIHRPLVRAMVLALAAMTLPSAAAALTLRSPAFHNGGSIPKRFTCDGAGISPPLAITGAPAAAKSLALIVDDPDAPSGDWVHWVLYDLAPGAAKLPANASRRTLPGPARSARNSFHHRGYGGLCPPHGDGAHHYRFTLYALDARLPGDLRNRSALRAAMQGHVLSHARLTGRYRRQ